MLLSDITVKRIEEDEVIHHFPNLLPETGESWFTSSTSMLIKNLIKTV